jgi:hypothetical protein
VTDQATWQADQFPELKGYLSVARVAELFGMKKASIYYKIYEQRRFKQVFRVPGATDDARPVLVLLESEVRQVLAEEQANAEPSPQQRLTEWHRRVKAWGRDNGYELKIHAAGKPLLEICEAYERANPQDPHPE